MSTRSAKSSPANDWKGDSYSNLTVQEMGIEAADSRTPFDCDTVVLANLGQLTDLIKETMELLRLQNLPGSSNEMIKQRMMIVRREFQKLLIEVIVNTGSNSGILSKGQKIVIPLEQYNISEIMMSSLQGDPDAERVIKMLTAKFAA